MLSFSDLNTTVAGSKPCKCLLSGWERNAGYRMQRAMVGGNCKEAAVENIDEICGSVHRQLLSITLSSTPMFASGKKQAGMHRFNCIFLYVAYLGEKHVTHCNTRVLFPHTYTHREIYCTLITNCSQTRGH